MFCDNENPCIDSTRLVVSVKSEKQVKRGQGEGETKWKGCAWKLVLVKLVIVILIIYYIFLFYYIRFYYFLLEVKAIK